LDYDVSVSADKRRRQRVRGMSGCVASGGERTCDWPGCNREAAYRAPVSRERLNEFRWYCLEHVRQYNKSWNFFADYTESEIDAQMRADRTWERPTWKLGKAPAASPHGDGRAWARWGFSDPHEVLGDAATINGGAEAPGPKRRLLGEEARALDVLGLAHDITSRAEIRQRFRELVRDLHPDMNGGDTSDSERLSRVLRAWDILKKSRNFTE
ncbi:MAG: J domain-containing protein, partial [Pseudomonadota bacterium]